jgi:ABC-type amino acid transport substrate-binding protein
MKTVIHVIATAVLLLLPTSADDHVISLFGNNNKAPKVYEADGKPRGILIDILKMIERDSDLSFDIKLYPWNRSYAMATRGSGGIFGLSKNEERLKIFDYSDPMYYDENVLVVLKKKVFQFNTYDDLKGKIIGNQRGTSYGFEFEEGKKLFKVEEDSSPVARIQKLLRGRIDAAIIGGPGDLGLKNILAQSPELKGRRNELVVLKKPITRDANYIGFHKSMQKADVITEINAALKKAHESGKINQIREDYVSGIRK